MAEPFLVVADQKIRREEHRELFLQTGEERKDRPVPTVGGIEGPEEFRRLVQGFQRRNGHSDNLLSPGEDPRMDLFCMGRKGFFGTDIRREEVVDDLLEEGVLQDLGAAKSGGPQLQVPGRGRTLAQMAQLLPKARGEKRLYPLAVNAPGLGGGKK